MSYLNLIREPGKFEGERMYAPVLYALMLDGADDETLYDGDVPISVFVVDDELRNVCNAVGAPLDVDVAYITLYENEQGFICCTEWNASNFERIKQELAQCDETDADA